MQESIKINVRLTLTDIKSFIFAKAYGEILGKIFLMLFIPFCFLYSSFIFFIMFARGMSGEGNGGVIYDIISISSVLIINFIIFLPYIIIYMTQKKNYFKSKLMGILQCYEINKEGIRVLSPCGTFFIGWGDICKVLEMKPCFLIFTSPAKVYILPRRCFFNESQLDMFNKILIYRVEKNKLKLKGYMIGKAFPDYGEVIITGSDEEFLENDIQDLLFEQSFQLDKKEILEMNFKLYYKRTVVVVVTIMGMLLLFLQIVNLIKGNFDILVFFCGVFLTLLTPLIIYLKTIKQYRNDTNLKNYYNFRFFSDCFIVKYSDSINRIRWNELFKITELKSVFLFFVTTQIAYVVPKRAFKNKEEIEVLKKYCFNKKISK